MLKPPSDWLLYKAKEHCKNCPRILQFSHCGQLHCINDPLVAHNSNLLVLSLKSKAWADDAKEPTYLLQRVIPLEIVHSQMVCNKNKPLYLAKAGWPLTKAYMYMYKQTQTATNEHMEFNDCHWLFRCWQSDCVTHTGCRSCYKHEDLMNLQFVFFSWISVSDAFLLFFCCY